MRTLIITALFIFISIAAFSQMHKEEDRKSEYASIYMRVRYNGNRIIYERAKSEVQSPVITMPEGVMAILLDNSTLFTKDDNLEFMDVGHVLNYMSLYGWKLITSNALPYISNDMFFKTEYQLILMFERPYKSLIISK